MDLKQKPGVSLTGENKSELGATEVLEFMEQSTGDKESVQSGLRNLPKVPRQHLAKY